MCPQGCGGSSPPFGTTPNQLLDEHPPSDATAEDTRCAEIVLKFSTLGVVVAGVSTSMLAGASNFATASRRWSGLRCVIIALLSALLLLVEGVKSGWLIPILVTLIYVLAVGSLHRARAAPQATPSSW